MIMPTFFPLQWGAPFLGLIAFLCMAPHSRGEEIEIPDKWLEGAIRVQLGQWEGDSFLWDYDSAPPLTQADMERLTTLRIETGPVVSLEGLQAAVNLEALECFGLAIEGGLWGPGVHAFQPVLGGDESVLQVEAVAGGGQMDVNFSPLLALPKLRRLALHGNGLGSVATLEDQESLEILDLSENLIEPALLEETLAALPNLRELHLRSNFIETFSPSVELHGLDVLDLSFNPLTTVELPESWWGLKVLGLNSTQVWETTLLQHLTQLEVLEVGDSPSVPWRDLYTAMPPLKSLDLSGHGILGTFALEDALLHGLESLNLDGNFLSEMPESHRAAITRGSSPATVADLIFVGDPSEMAPQPTPDPVSKGPLAISSIGEGMRLLVNGLAGDVVIESSRDLSQWNTVATLTLSEDPALVPVHQLGKVQFFRARFLTSRNAGD